MPPLKKRLIELDWVGCAQVASLDMWGTIMFSAVDVVGPGHAPTRNANKYAALYFLCFLFIVCFFVQVRGQKGAYRISIMDEGSRHELPGHA